MTFLKFFLNFREQLPFREAARSALSFKILIYKEFLKTFSFHVVLNFIYVILFCFH